MWHSESDDVSLGVVEAELSERAAKHRRDAGVNGLSIQVTISGL